MKSNRGTSPVAACTAAVASALIALPLIAQSPFPADEDLGVMLHYIVEDGATPGIVLGIVDLNGGRIDRVLTGGSGGPDMPSLTDRSVFELGSITKTFTGTLLALAVRRGEVSLDDPVADHLPDSVTVPSRDGREITLLDLATHRSGLPSLPTNYVPGDLANPYADYTLEVLYDFLSSYELPRTPGEEAEYSNLGFGLLGHVLARAAGTSYPELLRSRILDPLGMHETAYGAGPGYTDAMAEGMTQPHSRGEAVPAWTTGEAIRGAGGLRSTMADMLKYLAANLRPPQSELGAAMRDAQRARRPFGDSPAPGSRIGLAWRTITAPGPDGERTIIEHGGNSAGSSGRIAFDPDRRVGFVRLTNTGDFSDDLGLFMLRTGPPLDRPVADVPEATLRSYAGAYRFAPGVELNIRYDDRGWLTSQLGPTVRFRLYPESETAFYLKRIPARFAFRVTAAGEVDAAVLNPGPRERVMPKVGDDTPDPHLPVPEILDLPLTAEDIARYEGSYLLPRTGGDSLEVRVRGEDGLLVADLVGGATARLRYQGDHVFVPVGDPASRATFRVQDGRAVGVQLNLHGTVMTGRRSAGS